MIAKQLLYAVVLVGVVGVLAHGQGQGKGLGPGAFQNLVNEGRSRLSDLQKNGLRRMLDRFPDITSNVKEKLKMGTFQGMEPIQLINQIPPKLWTAIGVGPILKMGRENITILLQKGRNKIPKRLSNLLEDYMASNVTREEAISSIQNLHNTPKRTESRMQMLLSKLGNPARWTNITDIKQILFTIPAETLMRITNRDALEQLQRQINLCITSGSSTETSSYSCPPKNELTINTNRNVRARRMMQLRTWLSVKLNGPPEMWSVETFNKMDVYTMPPMLLAKIKPEVLASRKDQVLDVVGGWTGPRTGMTSREVTKKLLMADKIMEKTTVPQVQMVLNNLKSLQKFVLESDIPSFVLRLPDATQLRRVLDQNALRAIEQNMPLDQMTVGRLMGRIMSQGRMDGAAINDLGGLRMVALAPPHRLTELLNTTNLGYQQMQDLQNAIIRTGGTTARAKLQALFEKSLRMSRSTGGAIDIGKFPTEMLNMLSLTDIQKFDKPNARKILAKNSKLNPAQKALLTSQFSPAEMITLPANVRTCAATEQVKNLIGANLDNFVKDVPASAAVALVAATKTFGIRNNIAVQEINLNSNMVKYMGSAEAKKVVNDSILETMEAFNGVQPSMEACVILKDKFVWVAKQQMGAQDENEACRMLTAADIEKIPPCFVAAFGKTRLEGLGATEKSILMRNVIKQGQRLFESNTIPRKTIVTIMDQGFRAEKKPFRLSGVDVVEMSEGIILAPPDAISNMDKDAIPIAVRILNDMASTVRMPCLDNNQRGAIRKIIMKMKGGDPTKWEYVTDICCLLYTLTPSDLDRVPDAAMTQCNCTIEDEALFQSFKSVKEVTCMVDIGDDFNDEKMAKKTVMQKLDTATLNFIGSTVTTSTNNRRKRAVADLKPCQKAAVNGVDSLSTGDLTAMTAADVMGCLQALGSRDMDVMKAQVLVARIKLGVNNNLNNLKAEELLNMGFILKGLQEADIDTLPNLTYPAFNGAVGSMGMDRGFTMKQTMKFADKVKSTWRPLEQLNGAEIVSLNNLLCGLNEVDIGKLKNDEFVKAMPVLGFMKKCEMEKTFAALAAKALAAFGDTSNWEKFTVGELGVLVAGLAPEYLKAIKAEAMAGITPLAVKAMPPNVAQVLTADQLQNFPVVSAQALSASQKKLFSTKMLEAVNEALKGADAAAALMAAAPVLTLALAVALLLLQRRAV